MVFPLRLNISWNFTNSQVGTRGLEVFLSMYVVWGNHHASWSTFSKNLYHEKCVCLKISRFTKSCGCVPTGEARRQRVLCSWPMGSAPSGIQTTHRSSVAPKTGGFTLVGGVQLGHRDLMGCIPTLY